MKRTKFPVVESTVILGGILLTGLLGTMMPEFGSLFLFSIASLTVAALFLSRPAWGLYCLAALLPIQNVFVVSSGVTLAKAVGAAVFAAWAARKLLTGGSIRAVLSSNYFWVGGLMVGLAFSSELWARAPGRAVDGAQQLLLVFGLGVIVVDVVRDWLTVERLIKALVAGALVAAVLTLEQSLTAGVRRAGDDIGGGVNATASLLVTVIPFGFFLLRERESRGWQALGLAYLIVGPLAIVTTYSRFNLLLLPIVLFSLSVGWLLRRGGRKWVLVLTGASMVVGLTMVPWERVQNRVTTIGPYLASTLTELVGAGGGAVSERGYHMRVGLAIASEHPIAGAGYSNYGVLFRDEYQFRVPGRPELFGGIRNPHSSHIGILANLGFIGLGLWGTLLVVIGLGSAFIAMKATRFDHRSSPHLLARGMIAALALQIFAYGWYASTDREPLLWLLLAVSAAMASLTDTVEGRTGAEGRTTVFRVREPGSARVNEVTPVPAERGWVD